MVSPAELERRLTTVGKYLLAWQRYLDLTASTSGYPSERAARQEKLREECAGYARELRAWLCVEATKP